MIAGIFPRKVITVEHGKIEEVGPPVLGEHVVRERQRRRATDVHDRERTPPPDGSGRRVAP
jgi:hypothetical protein